MLVQALAWLDEIRARRQDPPPRRHQLRHAATRRRSSTPASPWCRCRRSIPCWIGGPRPASPRSAAARDVGLLCYGTVAGGFLGDRWLGQAEPTAPLENRSLTKYKLIIDDFGGWALFQELLRACRAIADRHGVDIATVASRFVLDRPGVTAVIVGGRSSDHARANAAIGDLRLTAQDGAELDAVLARRQGPEGEPYALERDRTGRHGAVMKYNLNAAPH